MPRSSIQDELDSYGKATGPRTKGFRAGATRDLSRISSLALGGRCLKYTMMGEGVFLIICGAAILAGGGYINNDATLSALVGTDFLNCILAFGAILLVIGICGLVGAMNENRAILACFVCVLATFMLVIMIFGAWAVSRQGQEGQVISRIWTAMSQDQKNSIQNAYVCCGAYYFGQSTNINQCPSVTQTQKGPACFPALISDYRKAYTGFGAGFIVIACIMIVCIITSWCLMRSVGNAMEAKAKSKKPPK